MTTEETDIPDSILMRLICNEYLEKHLRPMIKSDGREISIERLHNRSKLQRKYCERIVDFLENA